VPRGGVSDELSDNQGGAGWTLPDVYGQQRDYYQRFSPDHGSDDFRS
jgi:hypothetical protein